MLHFQGAMRIKKKMQAKKQLWEDEDLCLALSSVSELLTLWLQYMFQNNKRKNLSLILTTFMWIRGLKNKALLLIFSLNLQLELDLEETKNPVL